jgi:hypothetical protein
MRKYCLTIVAGSFLACFGGDTFAQDTRPRDDQSHSSKTQFDDHSQQVTRDWYQKNQAHPPAGLRNQDRLSADQESRLHEGATLDSDLRKKVHPAPKDLERQLPPAPSQHRYVAIGGHIGLIDDKYQVKGVVHLHDQH